MTNQARKETFNIAWGAILLALICGILILASTWMPWHSRGLSGLDVELGPFQYTGWNWLTSDGLVSQRSYVFLVTSESVWTLTGAWTILFGIALIFLSVLYLVRKTKHLLWIITVVGVLAFIVSIIARVPHGPPAEYGGRAVVSSTAIGGWVFIFASVMVVLAVATAFFSERLQFTQREKRTKKCPYCAERIKSEAIKCRYCGSDLGEAPE